MEAKKVSIDSKNRIIVPTSFSFSPGDVALHLDPIQKILFIYSEEDFEVKCKRDLKAMNQLSLSKKEIRSIQRYYTASLSFSSLMDSRRRITLEPSLIQKLDISKEAYLLMVDNHLELSKEIRSHDRGISL